MSTDMQRYSLDNQASAISDYALQEGFIITRSYEDAGRSGVSIKGRSGLAQLIGDVVGGTADFGTVLVLDVSRWGRFQDPDEAAHYEFLCRSAGVEVRYCAETFGDDPSASVMKQLKRVMAGEYSRELSLKVRRGKRRQADLGHSPGGVCPYGIGRQEVLADGTGGPLLKRGQRKSRPEHSVRFVPGPPEEQAIVRRIFRLYVHNQMPPHRISDCLKQSGAIWHDGTPWTKERVASLLICDLLGGQQMAGKFHNRMGLARSVVPRSEWRVTSQLQPVVSSALFKAAGRRQRELGGSKGQTRAEMLSHLRRILATHGKLTFRLIQADKRAPCGSSYYYRFGNLSRAFAAVGYATCAARNGRGPSGALLDRTAILAGLRRLERDSGRVTVNQIAADPSLPSPHMIRKIFGSIPAAYAAAEVLWGHPRRKENQVSAIPDQGVSGVATAHE